MRQKQTPIPGVYIINELSLKEVTDYILNHLKQFKEGSLPAIYDVPETISLSPVNALMLSRLVSGSQTIVFMDKSSVKLTIRPSKVLKDNEVFIF